MVRNLNDGLGRAPYLRVDLNLGTLTDLPEWSKGPRGKPEAVYAAIKEAGYEGVQGGDVELCRRFGLGATTSGRVNVLGEVSALAAAWKAQGYECATLHVAWGIESDQEALALATDIVDSSEKHDLPLYIETHRATLTQDIWRTVQLVKQLPQLRFNADFSHWYTGLEMPYGDFEAKLRFMEPVLDRVRYFHGRIGNPSNIQVKVEPIQEQPFVTHFRQLWTRSMEGFLRSAGPGDYLCFAPELLHPAIFYARVFEDGNGNLREECYRWEQALLLSQIARECFRDAQSNLKQG